MTRRLSAILAEIMAVKGGLPEPLDLRTSFTALDFSSVDYLEFVLNVEADLNIDIPDEALLDPALCSVATWADWLADNAAALRTPAIGTSSA
ncbi:hypothetical protein OO17_22445 [Rhodopseudomonas palustris]|uniref:Carrier domain-containing protein n=1 Tax=Rhodopseudomonas palustris TaxID=1076 RepID=A0A0D7EDY3_RHOPL|nr:hypothetical protein OO17_22445 [Rhodopseudomonas palustris]